MTDTAPTEKPKRKDPRTERTALRLATVLGPKPPEVKAAALSATLDAELCAPPAVVCSPEHIERAANLIDSAAATLPPQRKQDSATDGQTGTDTGNGCSEMLDGAGFKAWVAENPGSRARAAAYLAEAARTGKLAASMDSTGMTVGALSCLEQRHPVIRAALNLIRNTHARKLASRAREVVEDVMVNPDDQTIQLRAAGLAMQYGPKDGGTGSGEGSGDAGGVQIVINMGAPPAAGAAIPMEQVKGKSLFVQSR